MARPKEFDRDDALAQATTVFWRKGYESTSVQDLVDEMGIGRASLYDTFGSKKQLFAEAMDRYADMMESEFSAPLRRPGSPRRILKDLFTRVAELRCGGDRPTCLMVKTALLAGQVDEATAKQVAAHQQRLENAFYDLMVRARKEGVLKTNRTPRALARFLLNTLQGLTVSTSVCRQRRPALDIIHTALSLLR